MSWVKAGACCGGSKALSRSNRSPGLHTSATAPTPDEPSHTERSIDFSTRVGFQRTPRAERRSRAAIGGTVRGRAIFFIQHQGSTLTSCCRPPPAATNYMYLPTVPPACLPAAGLRARACVPLPACGLPAGLLPATRLTTATTTALPSL